jgi:chemotaxis protein MotC
VTPRALITVPLLGLALACGSAQGEETRTPVDLIRALRASQDRITQGATEAQLSQRTVLTQIGEQLAAVQPETWKEPRNARAALAFVLCGGAPATLKKLIELGAIPAIDDKLARGVLAYGEARDADALELLSAIDARELNASIAGHIALAQAELTAKKDPKKALDFLDDARLLAPGTLIEEAALRRQVGIVAATGEFGQFEMLATDYLRRFAKSVYANAFRRQFAADVAARADTGDGDHIARLQTALDALEPAERRDIYLVIAREALVRGRTALARVAASNAAPLFDEGSMGRLQAGIYEAAALVLNQDIDKGAFMLEAMDTAKLGEEEAELVAAAGSVAAEIRHELPFADAPVPAGGDDLAKSFKVVETARAAMARADALIDGARK